MVYWTVLTVTTGRDGKTVVKMEPWSRPVDNFTYRELVPSRPVKKISPVALYRPVPSRRGNIPLPSRPVYKTYPYRPVPS